MIEDVHTTVEITEKRLHSYGVQRAEELGLIVEENDKEQIFRLGQEYMFDKFNHQMFLDWKFNQETKETDGYKIAKLTTKIVGRETDVEDAEPGSVSTSAKSDGQIVIPAPVVNVDVHVPESKPKRSEVIRDGRGQVKFIETK